MRDGVSGEDSSMSRDNTLSGDRSVDKIVIVNTNQWMTYTIDNVLLLVSEHLELHFD